MKSPLIVARIDRVRDAALDLDAEDVGEQQFLPRDALAFADGEHGGEHRGRRMRQQSVDGFFRGRELRVIVIHRVAGCAVGERRFSGGSGKKRGPKPSFPRAAPGAEVKPPGKRALFSPAPAAKTRNPRGKNT